MLSYDETDLFGDDSNGNDPKFPTREDGSRDIVSAQLEFLQDFANDRYLTAQDTEWTIAQTWEGMEKVLASGKARAIGVSNFSQAFLDELLKTAKTVPAANQSEFFFESTSAMAQLLAAG